MFGAFLKTNGVDSSPEVIAFPKVRSNEILYKFRFISQELSVSHFNPLACLGDGLEFVIELREEGLNTGKLWFICGMDRFAFYLDLYLKDMFSIP